MANELNVDDAPYNAPEALLDLIQDAIDLASDQDQMTYLTNSEGKRIAAIVPVDMAEHATRHGYGY
jgi:hypothetical protein